MTAKLTDPQLRVLLAAATGDLYRSQSLGTLYRSFLRGARGRDVTAIVERLTDREPPLLELGERDGFTIPWLLTDAGRTALDTVDNT